MSEIRKLMRVHTKSELAEMVLSERRRADRITDRLGAGLPPEDIFTATVLDLDAAERSIVTTVVTLEVDATPGDLMLVRAGRRVSLSLAPDLDAALENLGGHR